MTSTFNNIYELQPLLCLFQVRQWWSSCPDKRSSDHVERFTVTLATPVLWQEEAREIVGSKAAQDDSMTVRNMDQIEMWMSAVREVSVIFRPFSWRRCSHNHFMSSNVGCY